MKTGAGASDQDTRVLLRSAMVLSVDGGTASIRFTSNEAPYDGAIIATGYSSTRGKGWTGFVPEESDHVMCAKMHDSPEWYIIGSLPLAFVPESGSPEDTTDEDAPRNNFGAQLPGLLPGEMGMVSPSGAKVLLRKGGNVELHADRFCSLYLKKNIGLVKTICKNFILDGFFGKSSYWTYREDGRDELNRTPTGYSLALKSHVQNAPHIFLDAGAVLEEENLPFPGYPPLSDSAFGRGCSVRFMLFEQSFADAQSSAGISPPDPRRARMILRMSSSGDVWVESKGHWYQKARDYTLYVDGRNVQQSGSYEHTTTQGGVKFQSEAGFSVHAKLPVAIKTSSRMELRARGFSLSAADARVSLQGGFRLEARGSHQMQIGGHQTISADGDHSHTIGGSSSTTIGDRKTEVVFAQGPVENVGRDIVTRAIRVRAGKSLHHAAAGSVQLSSGGTEDVPAAYLRMHLDPLRSPQQAGRVELGTALGARLILDANGGWQLAGLGGTVGSIHSDSTGRIQLGPIGGLSGYVVTTTSHTCPVTGLPPRGNPLVSITQTTPGVPTPAVIVPPPIPTVPLPKATAFV